MKKLLVSLLVLAMTSSVSAEITISIDGITGVDEYIIQQSDTITIGIYNAGSGQNSINFLSYLDFYYKSENGYSLFNPRLGPAAGNIPASFTGPYNGGYDNDEIEITQEWAEGSSEIIDDIFLVDFYCELPDVDVYIELWDGRVGYSSPVDTLVIHQVPEPTTFLLIGLGGLFLRKGR